MVKVSEFVRLPSEIIISAGKYPALERDVKSKVISPVPSPEDWNVVGTEFWFTDAEKTKSISSLSISENVTVKLGFDSNS